MKLWRNLLLVLALIWGGAWLIVYEVRRATPTAESLTSYLAAHPLSSADRAKVIAQAGEQLNALSYEDRQKVQDRGAMRGFFEQLTPDEQSQFLDATLPSGFKQMMEAFNKMDPEKRRRFVSRALEDAKKRQGDAPPPGANEQMQQKIVNQGLKSFYTDASADVKLDMAPLIEQMQRNLQQMH